ncbi:MAG: C45 family autoproteolytic acyltransferase/hydrolase [Polyangiales bacterium]
MRVFALPAEQPPCRWGQAHGENFRPLIQELCAIRNALALEIGGFADLPALHALAARHWPILEAWSPALAEEMRGIAAGADVLPEEILVLNHYTDLRDLGPARRDLDGPDVAASEGCSLVYRRGPAGALLGQSWDMHASAIPYVLALKVPETGHAPAAWVLSVVGCVGMAGLNSAGLGVTINNLHSRDARIGLVWPALVRGLLCRHDFGAARTALRQAPVGSGHHYFIAQGRHNLGLEFSGTRQAVVAEDVDCFVHTNHCLDAMIAARTHARPESTSQARLDWLTPRVSPTAPQNLAELWQLLGSHDGYPRSVCTHLARPEQPHAPNTCGGIAMDLQQRHAWFAPGCLHHARAHVVHLSPDATP